MVSKFLAGLKEQVDLQVHNSLAVPSHARWYAEAQQIDQLQALLEFRREKSCPLLILGEGSNVVLPDTFDGLVIKLANKGNECVCENEDELSIDVAAGENWHNLVSWSVDRGYYGIENLAYIPGTVGAAPIQNIGAYGVELKDCFESLEILDIVSGQRRQLNLEECQFAYRDSIFKRKLQDQVIITKVRLRLSKTPRLKLDYPDLANCFANQDPQQITSKAVFQAVIEIRQSKLPDPKNIPNAGSFFKNPVVDQVVRDALRSKFPQLVSYPLANGRYKLAAAWLLDKAGWKGKVVNGMAMHNKQALVLTNPGRQSGEALMGFAQQVQANINDQFGVHLEIEPRVFMP